MLIFAFADLSQLPKWMLFSGRLHPLVLHLPVTLVLCLIPLSFYTRKQNRENTLYAILQMVTLYTTLFTTLAALFGLLLSADGEYSSNTLQWHKWLGIMLALTTHFLLFVQHWVLEHKTAGTLVLTAIACIMLVGSHFGGSLTHGEEFFSFGIEDAPIKGFPEITDSTHIFSGAIQPVIAAKCASCHNDQKMKGGLNMSSFASLQSGGKTGAVWLAGDPERSLLTERMTRDPEDKKHMPPKGKAQLTATEILLFQEWIKSGATETLSMRDLKDNDTLKTLVYQVANTGKTPASVKQYNFSAAAASTIASLNTPFRRILPLAYQSPALSVKFFLKEQFNPEMLKACSAIKEQVVEVNLSGMPVDDELIKSLTQFTNIERLNLNGTSVTGKNFNLLTACEQLEQISLAGTAVKLDGLIAIATMPSLKKVFLWNSQVNEKDIARLTARFPRIKWDMGYIPDKNELLKLTPPYPANRDKAILDLGESITLKHPLPGVKIRYTVDGSEPDTATGAIFSAAIPMKGLLRIRSVATATGWISSNISEQTFFQRGIKTDSVTLINAPDAKYRKFGSKALTDEVKGEAGNFGMNWLGFKDSPLKAGFHLSNSKLISEVVLSMADNTGSYIFPPVEIIVKAGDSPANMQLVGKLKPEMPKQDRSNAVIPYSVAIKPGNYRYVEVEAVNIQKLPGWHRGKGEKGWVFVDEVFFY